MTAFTLLLIVFLAAVSLVLSTVEAAFYLFRRRRLSHLTENPKAELVNGYLADPPSILMPVHLGAYSAHVAMTVLLTSLLLDVLGHGAMLAALAVMTVHLLLFRLTIPYAVARQSPERVLVFLVPLFHFYAMALGPIVRQLRRTVEPAFAGTEPAQPATADVPPPPAQDEDEARLAESLVRFGKTQVREVMTPRPDVVAVAAQRTVNDLRRVVRETRYSRIPLFGENLDDIVGFVEVRDLIAFEGPAEEPARTIMRPVFLVPETKRIAELLREMQRDGLPFAVVIDEYGVTAGLVSVEDIVEELVGEIKDEYDQETEPMRLEADGSILVSGRVSLERLGLALELDLSEEHDVETVGGLATTVFGRIPSVGEQASFHGLEIQIVDAERKRVNLVRFRRSEAGEVAG